MVNASRAMRVGTRMGERSAVFIKRSDVRAMAANVGELLR